MPLEKVFGIICKDAPKALDGRCVEALVSTKSDLEALSIDLRELSARVDTPGANTKQEEKSEVPAVR